MVGWLARNLSQQLYLENDGSFGFTGDGRFQGSNRSPIPDARKTECSCHVRRKRKHNPRLPRAPPGAVSHSISPKATRLHEIKKKKTWKGCYSLLLSTTNPATARSPIRIVMPSGVNAGTGS